MYSSSKDKNNGKYATPKKIERSTAYQLDPHCSQRARYNRKRAEARAYRKYEQGEERKRERHKRRGAIDEARRHERAERRVARDRRLQTRIRSPQAVQNLIFALPKASLTSSGVSQKRSSILRKRRLM